MPKPAPNGFSVLAADPPWFYAHSRSTSRKIDTHYPTMRTADIAALDVAALCDPAGAVCYLWVPAPKLFEGMLVLAAWGFAYKTHRVWDKMQIGMGYWTRGKHEDLLIGTTGRKSPPAPANRPPSLLHEARSKVHSRKPTLARQQIEAAHPHEERLELFARETHPGWTAWGHGVESAVSIGTRARSTMLPLVNRIQHDIARQLLVPMGEPMEGEE
jgi:N6-adenosine-specific RNA methylase IME4